MKNRVIGKTLAGVAVAALLLSGCGQSRENAEETKAAETQMTEAQATATTEEETIEAQETEIAAKTEETPAGDLEAAPDFEAKLISGETVNLSDYQGKKVLLNFWATWCGPCVGEMPALQKLSEEYPDDLVVLAVNSGEDEKTVKQFTDKNGYTFPIALDTELKIGNLYPGVMQGIPYTVIINEEGDVMAESTGAADADTMYGHYKEMMELE